MTQAYIIIDMQNDFIDGSLGTPEAQAIVPHVEAKIVASKKDTDQETDLILRRIPMTAIILKPGKVRNSPFPTASRIRGAGASANSFCHTR